MKEDEDTETTELEEKLETWRQLREYEAERREQLQRLRRKMRAVEYEIGALTGDPAIERDKYVVEKADGAAGDPEARYFVLRVDGGERRFAEMRALQAFGAHTEDRAAADAARRLLRGATEDIANDQPA